MSPMRPCRRLALPVRFLFVSLLLAGCGGGPGAPPNPPPQPPPLPQASNDPFAISIQQPTALLSHVTAAAEAEIGGTCLGSPDSMSWSNAAGGSGVIPPGAQWTVRIPLQPGPNRIRVVADKGTQAVDDEILVVRDAAVLEVSTLEIRPSGVLVGEANAITAKAVIHLQQDPTAVELWRVELGGTPIAKEADLLDDGSVASGDERADDFVYTGQFPFTAPDTRPTYLMARIEHPGGVLWSPLGLLTAANPLDAAQIQAAADAITAVGDAYLAALGAGDHEAGVQAALAALAADPLVVQSGRAGGMGGVWMIYRTGIAAGLLLTPDGFRGGGSRCDPRPDPSTMFLQAYFLNEPGNEIPVLHDQLEAKTCTEFEPNEEIFGDAVTINALKRGGTRGIFAIATHGDTWYEGVHLDEAVEDSPDLFGVYTGIAGEGEVVARQRGISITQAAPILLTAQRLEPASAAILYGADIANGRIVLIGNPRAATIKLGITPHFVQEYMCLQNAIVYLGACRSTYNTKLADAFIGRGALQYPARRLRDRPRGVGGVPRRGIYSATSPRRHLLGRHGRSPVPWGP